MFVPSLERSEIPAVFEQLSLLISPQSWLTVAEEVEEKIASTPTLGDHLRREHELPLLLAHCSRAAADNDGVIPFTLTRDPTFYPAFTFARQVVDLVTGVKSRSKRRADSLIRRVRVALCRPYEAKAIQFELMVATHFLLRGRKLWWPELGPGKETFDLLVEDLGPSGLEIECKYISNDKGRKVHREDVIRLHDKLMPRLTNYFGSRRRAVAVVVTLTRRLSSDENELDRLVEVVVEGLFDQNVHRRSEAQVRWVEFDVARLGQLTNPPSLQNREVLDAITGTKNREMALFGTPAGGLLVVVIQSALSDSTLHETIETFKDAASRQLTGTRAGILLGQLAGLTADQLKDLGTSDKATRPSALAEYSDTFLRLPDLDHVVGIGFLSAPSLERGVYRDSQFGTTYTFMRRKGPFWSDQYSGLFGS